MSTELSFHKNFSETAGLTHLKNIFRQYSNFKDTLEEKLLEKYMKTGNQQITSHEIFNWS